MKKWLGAISSFVTGVLLFVFTSLVALRSKFTMGSMSEEETIKGFKLMNYDFGDTYGAQTSYKVFTIIMLVLAGLLIAMAIVLALRNLKVLKLKKVNLSLINNILLTVTLLVVLGAFISNLSLVSALKADLKETIQAIEAMGGKAVIRASVAMYLNLGIALIGSAMAWAFDRK